MLAVASADGYCSFLIFDKHELGEVYEPTGELANLMKIQEFVPPQMPSKIEKGEEREGVEYREGEGGVKKKRIIPKKVADI